MRRCLPFVIAVFTLFSVVLLLQPPRSTSGAMRATNTSGLTTITTDTVTIPTYPYASFLFTATNTTYNISYQWLHWANYLGSNPQPADKSYIRLTLENDWLRVSVLPELGGRVYEFIDKSTGNNELYRNPVIKPTNWGPSEQGWWLAAGGIEWGLPVEEHGYETAIPWSYAIVTDTDGITITVSDSTAPDRLRAVVSIFLPNDRAVLIVQPRIENDHDVELNFKWWDDAMLAPGPGNSVGTFSSNPNATDLKFVFPETQVTVHSTGDTSLPQAGQPMSWPIYKNLDRSRLQNWNQWLGFFARPSASQDWVGALDLAHQEGVVRVFPRTIVPGTKGFGMGWRNPIGAAQWTDDGSYYAELHGGLAPTFNDSVSIGAHQAIEWAETWYPITGLTDLTTADDETAFQVQMIHGVSDNLELGVFTTRPIDHARVAADFRAPTGCGEIADWSTDLMTPATPFTYSHETQVALDSVAVILTSNDQVIAAYNVTNDGQPPVTWLYNLPPTTTQTTFPVILSGQDADCIRSFDAQVRNGWDGQWTDWLTATTQSTQWFAGEDGHTYYFRLRARDLAGNQSLYTDNPYGNGVISVLATPAPVLDTSEKVATPFDQLMPGFTYIGYSIDLWNSGTLTATVTLTDTLPSSSTLSLDTLSFNGQPAPDLFQGGSIQWSGIITPDQQAVINYHLSPIVNLPSGTVITNTVSIQYERGLITRTAATTVPYLTYLPFVARNAAP